ncbi:MAG: macro domain-containing protein [Synergistetes bacterium]|nr:MAG: Appr-1-p processing domain protein [bacterium 42_11]MBC7331825.1 macro domain-containing protein [Synergistota bacterium]
MLKIGKAVIRLQKGDITDLEVDAIVNAANNHLWMGAGVAGAIKKRGGEEIEREAVSKGPIPIGEAIVTKAGKLKAKYVIHAAVMGQDLKTSERMIREATYNSLLRADELSLRSIAFPAFGTGVGGFPFDRCAKAMLDEVRLYLTETENTNLEEIIFVLYTEEVFKAFERELKLLEEKMKKQS